MATTSKLFIVETRMLHFMHYVVHTSFKGVTTQKEFCTRISITPTAISAIRKGIKGFTTEQILQAHKVFGVDINYLFGLTTIMFPGEDKRSPIELLKDAVASVEATYGGKASAGLIPRAKKAVVKKVAK